jgi:hypothetical protein
MAFPEKTVESSPGERENFVRGNKSHGEVFLNKQVNMSQNHYATGRVNRLAIEGICAITTYLSDVNMVNAFFDPVQGCCQSQLVQMKLSLCTSQ